MEKNKKKKARVGLVILIISLVVLGFWAGIAGEFFARYYLSNFAFFRDFYFTDTITNGQRDIIIKEPKKVVVEQDLRINQIQEDIRDTAVGIYKKKQESENPLNNIFLSQDYFGQALVLTSDGWLISTNEVISIPKDGIVASYNKKTYEIEKIIEDDLTGVVFIKIDAENLPVISLADFEEVFNGQQVYIYNIYLDQTTVTNIKDEKYKTINSKFDFVSNSEELDRNILIAQEVDFSFRGAPLINSQGEIIGLLSSQNKIINQAIPLNYIGLIINQILKEEDIKRPYLGINYINLNNVYGLSEEQRQGLVYGALIWPDESGIAIASDSPLFDILVAGDIITNIEDQKLDKNVNLIDTLLQYKTGQEIQIKYLHDQSESEISLILK